ncbi:cell wall hydrolase [Mesorhizobium sp. ZC-5]|uniref:cell wall hydrolase n=1 Tax=Mesorhizobium sp. ZC-5 TaxID=2986066 RepID=UPI0021E871EE|nr:cell wall hydrolase [Mesorhizobium sp. ZC-5]MCV3239862.1 cell wall hydrolase [Mesorhizobium sp. ZC-5]
MIAGRWKTPLLLVVAASPFLLAGCTQSTGKLTDAISLSSSTTKPYAATTKDKECMARAMFFESNRSSRDGLVAVGSVVMNRLKSGKYGDDVCDVVGAKGQFAPGVMTRKMNSKALPDVTAAADAVLKGERHPKVKEEVMFFHTAGLKFPYKNMHYVTVAGGNAFYEKRSRRKVTQPTAPEAAETMVASAEQAPQKLPKAAPLPASAKPSAESQSTQLASAEPNSDRFAAAPMRATLPADFQASSLSAPQEPVMSYEASAESADAIGALLMTQDRPFE